MYAAIEAVAKARQFSVEELMAAIGNNEMVRIDAPEVHEKTCGMNRDMGFPQVFLLLKLYCSDIINMTYRCRVICVSI